MFAFSVLKIKQFHENFYCSIFGISLINCYSKYLIAVVMVYMVYMRILSLRVITSLFSILKVDYQQHCR